MKAIDRKLIRDAWNVRGQVVAIALVIACGVATFVMSLSTLQALERSKAAYYERYRFADVFTRVKRAPKALLLRLEAIPGVAKAKVNIVADVNLSVSGFDEAIVGRLVSIPERRHAILNDLHLREGRWIERDRGEAIVSEAFAQAHGLHPGDQVSVVLNGRYQELHLVGIAISPEYIFQMSGSGLFPDDLRFGVFWMGEEELAASFDMKEAFNNLAITLAPGANEAEVIRLLDVLTEPYGGLGAHGREHQVSNRYISDEIRQLRGMTMILPTMFLGVAAFLLNVVMLRLVNVQREQIAALKAFGYTQKEIAIHYLKLASIVVLLGSMLGVVAGFWLGRGMTGTYGEFYRFPLIDYQYSIPIAVAGLAISALAGGIAVFQAIRGAARLPPAEAMRPEPPAHFRRSLLERLGIAKWFTPAMHMIVRQLERRPMKALFSIVGIAMALGILVGGNFGKDTIDYLMDFQSSVTQRQDMTVTFVEPRNARALQEIAHLPGVLGQEGFRSVPCRLRNGHRSYLLGITGLPSDTRLVRMVESTGDIKQPPQNAGVILSSRLGKKLGVRAGDTLLVDVLEGRRLRRQVVVDGLIEDYSGLAAYMSLAALNRLMQEGPVLSGAYVQVDQRAVGELHHRFKAIPLIAGVSMQKAAMRSFQETMGENMMRMRAFNIVFASIIAFGVVYNNARIALSERGRELATLRVLGFTRSELSLMLVTEMLLQTLIAIPLGLLIGRAFVLMISASATTEFYQFPAIINRSSYAFATLVIMIATALSCGVIFRRVNQLDMIDALKCKE